MKAKIIAGAVLSCLLSFGAANAVTVADGYHGGIPNNPVWAGQDVVGLQEHFDISHAEITLDANTGIFQVSIFSQYFDNVGRRGTTLGDLFLSSDGWNPFGSAPYNDDTAFNGEDWEHVFVMDDHGDALIGANGDLGGSMLGQSGTFQVYSVVSGNIELSTSTGDFRQFQEAQYNPGNQMSFGQGRWGIFDVLGSAYDELRFQFFVPQNARAGLLENLGFHWTMTCGNDVIEGAGVPEPTTMALFALGAAGLVSRRRKRA